MKSYSFTLLLLSLTLSSCSSVQVLSSLSDKNNDEEKSSTAINKTQEDTASLGVGPTIETRGSDSDLSTSFDTPATPDDPEEVKEKSEESDLAGVLEEIVEKEDSPLAEKDEDAYSDVDKKIEETEKEIFQSADSVEESEGTDLDLTYGENLYKFWKKYFTKRDKKRFIRHLKNGERYRSIVRKVFNDFGLPEDLFYVGLIESGFNIHIKSHAAAVGPWQFIKGTATRYGLRVENQIDERRNIIKATMGAARYFRDLYNIFGSWELALCAYNAGEYRIINAIRRGNTRNYKELVEKKLLPKETIYYIPKVAAARDLSKNREKYDIPVKMKKDEFYTNAELVDVKRRFTLKELSKFTGIKYDIIQTLNPDLRWRVLSANSHRPVQVVLPKNKTQAVAKKFNQMKPKNGGTHYATHRVQRGDNLSKIAKAYGIGLNKLKSLNNLRGNRIYVGQKLRVRMSSSSSGKKTGVSSYRVRKGDNLSKIAKKLGTTVGKIKRLNGLSHSKIYVGQKLKVKGKTSKQAKEYRVRKGDYLIGIAKKFGVSLSSLKKINGLTSNKIRVGQKLKLKRSPASSSSQSFVYQVQKGDNLSHIARRFGQNLSTLKRTNNLSSGRIYVGQKLRIPNVAVKTYVVQKGDNLTKIAKRFRTSIQRIVSVNNLNSRRIFPRQKLRIPVDS